MLFYFMQNELIKDLEKRIEELEKNETEMSMYMFHCTNALQNIVCHIKDLVPDSLEIDETIKYIDENL